MTLETLEILPQEPNFPSQPATPDKKFFQPKPGSPVIPEEVWKKMSEEERKRFGDEVWREQA